MTKPLDQTQEEARFDVSGMSCASCALRIERIRRLENVVLSPHLAGASPATAEKGARIIAQEVRRFVRGEPLAYCANPEALRPL